MFINMRQFLATLTTFKLLLHSDQLFFSNFPSGDKLWTNHIYIINNLSENVLWSKHDKIATEICLKRLGTKKGKTV